jgi:hypothetical protein
MIWRQTDEVRLIRSWANDERAHFFCKTLRMITIAELLVKIQCTTRPQVQNSGLIENDGLSHNGTPLTKHEPDWLEAHQTGDAG